jgi:hypothetical protein
MSGIPLADVIRELRTELATAIEEGRAHELRFKPGNIDVELALEVRREGKAKAGVKFWVVEFGAEGTAGQTQSHKIRLSLQLVDRAGREVLIAGDVTSHPGTAAPVAAPSSDTRARTGT